MPDCKRSIFYNVVTTENQTTELLKNLLIKYEYFKKEFVAQIVEDETGSVPVNDRDISTQRSNGAGILDLEIKNDRLHIIIEIKKRPETALTENQPYNYLDSLFDNVPDQSGRYFAFLIPIRYKHKKECEDSLNDYCQKKGVDRNRTKILYWENIIKILRDESFKTDVLLNEFCSLLKSWYGAPVQFTVKEVERVYNDKDIPRIVKKLHAVVDGVKKLLESDYSIKDCMDYEQYGIDISEKNGQYLLYFGLWLQCWANRGTALCYGVSEKKNKGDTVKIFKSRPDEMPLVEELEEDVIWHVRGIPEKMLGMIDCAEVIAKHIDDVLRDLSSTR
jgi:hypothetical protein